MEQQQQMQWQQSEETGVAYLSTGSTTASPKRSSHICRNCKSNLQKLGVLIGKNMLVRQRQWLASFFEIMFPLLCGALVVFVAIPGKYNFHDPLWIGGIVFPLDEDFLDYHAGIEWQWCTLSAKPFIAYTPSNDETKRVMGKLSKLFQDYTCKDKSGKLTPPTVEVRSISDEATLESEYHKNNWQSDRNFRMAIIFPDGLKALNANIPKADGINRLPFILRFPPHRAPSTEHLYPVKGEKGYHLVGPDFWNLYYGFLYAKVWIVHYYLERILTREAIIASSGFPPEEYVDDNEWGGAGRVVSQPMSYPAYREGQGKHKGVEFEAVHALGVVVMGSSYLLLVSVTRNVLGEKASGITELLRLSGVPVPLQWVAWLIHVLLPHLLITVPGLTVFLCALSYMEYESLVTGDASLVVVILVLYVLDNCALGFLLSAISRKPLVASSAAVIVGVGSTFYALIYILIYHLFSFRSRIVSAVLFPNFALTAALLNLCLFPNIMEDDSDRGRRATWSNVWEWDLRAGENVSTATLMLIMAADFWCWMVLAVYLDGVLPSEHGMRKPWYFFDCFATLCARQGNRKYRVEPMSSEFQNMMEMESTQTTQFSAESTLWSDPNAGSQFESQPNLSSFEDDDPWREVGVQLVSLSKRFGDKTAVDGVSFKLFTGDIFALLGHNGAGKSTLISMLTGFTQPSAGTAFIGGYDVSKHVDKARENMGLCPQHNMLFDTLTVRETLRIFGMLRGMSCSGARAETEALLTSMNLHDKAKVLASKLSGGQKRKLQLGMALIGGTKLVILDEPTSGMDPQARREMWDMMLAVREGRTILLTTHFMEEADVLGDRLGIMADGKLLCTGTTIFLKKFYGTGYTLKLTLSKEDYTQSSSATPSNISSTASTASIGHPSPRAMTILGAVQSQVPNATLKASDQRAVVADRTEVSLNLPAETATTAALSKMFTMLSRDQDKLGIKTMGLSQTTMDQVFLRVGESRKAHKNEESSAENSTLVELVPKEKNKACVQFRTLFEKKTRHAVRRWQSFLLLSFLVTLFYGLTLFCGTASLLPIPVDQPENEASGQSGPLSSARSLRAAAVEPPKQKILKFSLEEEFFRNARPITLHNLELNDAVLNTTIGGCEWKRVKDVNQSLFSIAQSDKLTFKKRHLVAVEWIRHKQFGKLIVGKYNLHPYHMGTLAINLAFNVRLAVLKLKLSFRTQLSLHPFAGEPLHLDETAVLPSEAQTRQAIISDDKDLVYGSRQENDISELSSSATPAAAGEKKRRKVDTYYEQCVGERGRPKLVEIGWYFVGFLFAIVFPIGLFLFTAYFVVAPVLEKLCKAKHLQTMSGVSPFVYWGTAFAFDLGLYFTLALILLILLFMWDAGWNLYVFTANGGGGVFFVILLAYGVSVVPFTYVLSFRRGATSEKGAFIHATTVQIVGSFLLSMAPDPPRIFHLPDFFRGIAHLYLLLGRLFPSCVFSRALWYWGHVTASNGRCRVYYGELHESMSCPPVLPYWVWSTPRQVYRQGPYHGGYVGDGFFGEDPCGNHFKENSSTVNDTVEQATLHEPGVLQEVVILLIHGLIWTFFLLCIEFRLCSKMCKCNKDKAVVFPTPYDEDVLEEGRRVEGLLQTGQVGEEALVLQGLCKSFGNLAAVSWLQAGVHFGECFGLLGVNGAGKTTAFRMITGDETPTAGTVFGFGTSLQENRREFLAQIGYCPQFDAILPELSGAEMLDLFAGLRGVPFDQRRDHAMFWLRRMGLADDAHLACGRYSGGMKRRLSTAMAMIAEPSLILLDEPTSGVDPVSRQQFWRILDSTRVSGRQAVILTSHSMEECEALCARLTIMVNGQLQCLGPVQHLKSKFAQGYNMTLKLSSMGQYYQEQVEEKIALLELRISEKFAPCELKDKHLNLRQFHLQDPALRWDALFAKMEEVRAEFEELIEDYSVDETSLEQVFLAFARMQYPERKVERTCCARFCDCCLNCCC